MRKWKINEFNFINFYWIFLNVNIYFCVNYALLLIIITIVFQNMPRCTKCKQFHPVSNIPNSNNRCVTFDTYCFTYLVLLTLTKMNSFGEWKSMENGQKSSIGHFKVIIQKKVSLKLHRRAKLLNRHLTIWWPKPLKIKEKRNTLLEIMVKP